MVSSQPPLEAAPLLASKRSSGAVWVRFAAVGAALLGLVAYFARLPTTAEEPMVLDVEADGPDADASPLGWARIFDRKLLANDPRAVCNDGSPALYYFSPSAKGSSAWVVHLQGGGACVSAEQCAENEARYVAQGQPWHFSSTPSKPFFGVAAGTILSDAESPLLGDANAVYVWYCSSDAWVGDRGASDETGGRHFRGARIVDAVFDDLFDARGLGAAGEETVVFFAGSSAGGRGVAQHADRVAARVRERSGGRVLAVIDSALYLDDMPLPADAPQAEDGTEPGASTPWAEAYARAQLAFAHGRVSEGCAARFGGEDAWKCYVGEDALPTMETPFVAFQALDDSFLLQRVSNINQGIIEYEDADAFAARTVSEADYVRDRLTAAQEAAAARVHARYREAFAKFPKATAAVYAPSCLMHEHLTRGARVVGDGLEEETPAWWPRGTLLGNYRNLEAVGGESFASYVDRFAAAALDGGAPPAPLVDTCDGFACGTGCRSMHRGDVSDVVEPKSYDYAAASFDDPLSSGEWARRL